MTLRKEHHKTAQHRTVLVYGQEYRTLQTQIQSVMNLDFTQACAVFTGLHQIPPVSPQSTPVLPSPPLFPGSSGYRFQ